MTRILSVFNLLKRVGFALLLLLCSYSSTLAQPPETLWMREFGEEENGMALSSIFATSDGGVVVAATANLEQSYLVKYDSSGGLVWNVHTYLNDEIGGIQTLPCAIPVSGERILAVGWGYFQPGWPRAITTLFDANGDTLWRQVFDTLQHNNDTYGHTCLELDNGNFLIAGLGRRDEDILTPVLPFVVCYSPTGEELWNRYYLEDSRQRTLSINLFPMIEGGIGLVTYTQFPAPELPRYRVWTIGDSGEIVYEINLFDIGLPQPSINSVTERNIIDGGYTCRMSEVDIVRLNSNFEVQWHDSSLRWRMEPIAIMGEYLFSDFLVGALERINNGSGVYESQVIRFNANRDIVWTKSVTDLDSARDYLGPLTTILSDGTICMAFLIDLVESHVGVVRLSRDTVQVTNIGVETDIPSSIELIRAFPNPFNSTTTLRMNLPIGTRNVKLTVTNALGQTVEQREIAVLAPRVDIQLSLDNWPSGIYFAQAQAMNKIQITKLVLLK